MNLCGPSTELVHYSTLGADASLVKREKVCRVPAAEQSCGIIGSQEAQTGPSLSRKKEKRGSRDLKDTPTLLSSPVLYPQHHNGERAIRLLPWTLWRWLPGGVRPMLALRAAMLSVCYLPLL